MELERVLRGIARPSRTIPKIISRLPFINTIPFEMRVALDALERPAYAWCLLQAAKQAKLLGIPQIAAIEFGVAGGRGILKLESYSKEIERSLGVNIKIFGFDTGIGLSKPDGYKDMPYVWQQGWYEMDKATLLSKLEFAKITFGDVRETIETYEDSTPIGFISFDMDLYTPTKAALKIFDNQDARFLPRVLCSFDNIFSHDYVIHTKYVGELLAIEEFNSEHDDKKIDTIYGLRDSRVFDAVWVNGVYACHLFANSNYDQYLGGSRKRKLDLKS